MKRRKFIQTSSALSLPFFVGGTPFTAVGKNKLFDLIGDDSDRVLVMVQLQGGNDGLASIVPLDQFDNLMQVRSNVMIPQNALLNITDTISMHSNMGGMKDMYKDGTLNIIQGVAYPDQNRSHFRSTDIWHSASEPDEYLTTGWMGRYFDMNHSSFPEGYPNNDCPDPFALSIGTVIAETCQGTTSNYSLALTDPFAPGTVNLGEEGDYPANCYGRELDFIRDIAVQTNAYSDTITTAAEKGNSLSSKYADDNVLAQKLQVVARLISGGLKTKIYVVQLGGFDLHSNQVVAGNAAAGRQANLMQTLSDALCAFQDDCAKLGIADRVVGMTYSEFGRRIRSNESNGTDHGTAAPLFVFGSCVNPGIIGDNAEINPQADVSEGVAMQYDFRSVYASILMDWFGVSEQNVRTVLFKDFQHLPIIECALDVGTEELAATEIKVKIYPSPFDSKFTIQFSSQGEQLRISLFDAIGSEIKVITSKHFAAGDHELNVSTPGIAAGIYYVRIAGKAQQKTVRIVKA